MFINIESYPYYCIQSLVIISKSARYSVSPLKPKKLKEALLFHTPNGVNQSPSNNDVGTCTIHSKDYQKLKV